MKFVKLKEVLKQYRIETIVKNNVEYGQVTISKYDGVIYRGNKFGNQIGRKRQFLIDLKKYPNTLLFVRQGVEDGSIGFAPDEVDGCIVTENMPMFYIENINAKYLSLYMQSNYFKESVWKIPTTGSAQKSIHENQILEIEIPLPTLIEQGKIVKELETIKQKISILSNDVTHQQSLLKKLRQAILQEAVQGKLVKQDKNDEPASELLKRIKAEKEKLIAEGKLRKEKPLPPIKEEEIPFALPKGWVWCRLGEITSLITDGKHGDCQNQNNSGYYFLSAKDIQNGKLMYDGAREITYEDFLETHKRTNLEMGDLCVVNTGATIGKSAVTRESELTGKTTFQKSVAVIKVIKPFVDILFIELFVKDKTPDLVKTSRGSAINNLLLGDLKLTIVPLPPIFEQQRIVKKVNSLFSTCDQLEKQIEENAKHSEQLLQAVLKEAFEK